MPDPLPQSPAPADAAPDADAPDANTSGDDPGSQAPPPRDISGLIGPTLVGMAAGVAIILLLLWLG